MQVFLDAIYNNYIIFIAITIFLFLALIGYYVDKKMRKDSDIKPFFSIVGKNKDANAPKKEKKKKTKKGQKEYKSVVIGGEAPSTAPAVQQPAPATPSSVPPFQPNITNPVAPQPATSVQTAPNVPVQPQAGTPTTIVVAPKSVMQNQPAAAPASSASTPVAPISPSSVQTVPAAASITPTSATSDDEEAPMNLNMIE